MTRTLSAALLLAGVGLMALTSAPAQAADAAKEISTAAAHAGMAASSTDIKMVKAHLHHTINCLVGPKGDGYAANEEDPCKGMGAGAIADDPSKKAALDAAVAKAKSGIAATDIAAAKGDAMAAQEMLKKAGM